MKKLLTSVIASYFIGMTVCAQTSLKGFYYGNDKSPSGWEWQSSDSLSYNKEQPRATFWSFQDIESARQVLPENSKYWKSLNGDWSFNWVPTPDLRPTEFYKPEYDVSKWDTISVPSNWNIEGIGTDGSQKYGKPIYVNQKVIFWHQVEPGNWKGGVMRTPPENWTTYIDRNEVGSYRRNFTVPDDWKGREIYVSFDGVDSFFYLWINGKYVGFSKNSRNAARFDITKYIVKGVNTIAVEVYRNSDGSFFEAQDMFRLPGIFRTVALYSTPKTQINDLVVIPDLTDNYTNGILNIATTIRNLSGKNIKDLKIKFNLYTNKLYSDENEPVVNGTLTTQPFTVNASGTAIINSEIKVPNPNKWSAEEPWRYTLTAQLLDKKGNVIETVSTYLGFRKVEVKELTAMEDEFGLPGRYFLVNGKPVKLKGVNRHETDPSRGHAISKERMTEEVMMMKRANINHVRNSHYPDDPYWYYLADKYGIYLEDEANLESHEYYYGDASLSHVPELENAHVQRVMEMAHSTVNSPSIVIWSLGNEAGPGQNFVTAYNTLKEFDTSRPVQYERNNNIVDIGSNQYPSVLWVQEAVKGNMKIKYPFHISEYAHSMGNAVGNLVDYWNAIESTNHFMGGAIWDWIDQSLYNYDGVTGDRYLAFGGDFGDNPSDGQFVMNGVIFGDLQPKPQLAEVKKVYQNVSVTPVDGADDKFEVFNKNYFTGLGDYTLQWEILKDGKTIEKGDIPVDETATIGARSKKIITIPYKTKLSTDSEYFIRFSFIQKNDKPWAQKGYTQMSEQHLLKPASYNETLNNSIGRRAQLNTLAQYATVGGENFFARFDMESGTLYSLQYNGEDVIVPGHGPELCVFRAYLNNDNWIADKWFRNGLYNLQHTVLASKIGVDNDGNPILAFDIQSRAPKGGKMIGNNGNSRGEYSIDENVEGIPTPDFTIITKQIWTVFPDGSIELNSRFFSSNTDLVLPRLGYQMEVPTDYGTFTYYGRGPEENYNDRKTGQFVGVYSDSVASIMTEYTRPQSNGNREEVRWAALTNGENGLLVVAPELMSATASPYTEMQFFEASHPYKLPKSTSTVLHLDWGVTGLGGNSCGQGGPLEADRVKADGQEFTLIFRPANTMNLSEDAKILSSGLKPDPEIPEILKNFKKGPRVAFASSQEPDYGEAANLLDGDPGSIWHTMFSVTVNPFPHWIDFDLNEPILVNGITYLPRQDRNNLGNIKEYEVYVSSDGEQWGDPVAKGTFEDNKDLKKVKFDKPVTTRYIRFKALSAQDGREYATGAEFNIL